MYTERKIHYEGEQFTTTIPSSGYSGLLKCNAMVFEEKNKCGIAIGDLSWGLEGTRNIIAAWRGTRILEHFGIIGTDTLMHAYYAGLRNKNASTNTAAQIGLSTTFVVGAISLGTYRSIMIAKVPEKIIRATLDNQGGGPSPDITSIAQEIRAGTIKPRAEFANLCLKAVSASAR